MDTITLEVSRYRPEQESTPVFQSYEVPLRKDWVILDALNYIKDYLDGQDPKFGQQRRVKSRTSSHPQEQAVLCAALRVF